CVVGAGAFALAVTPAHAALRFHDFGHHEALPEREGLLRYAPRPRVLRPDLRLLDRPIVGVYERDGADVGRTLHVVLAAHRHHRGAPTADHAAGEHEVEERRDQISPAAVLREAHRPQPA